MSANFRFLLFITSIFLFSIKTKADEYFSCTFSEYVFKQLSPMGRLLVKEKTESAELNSISRGFVIDLT